MFRLNEGQIQLTGLSVLFLVVHIFPFLYFRQTLVLGFDTGFYRRYLLEPLTSIPHASVPGLDHTVIIPRIFMDLVRLSGLPTDLVLYGSYLLAAALLCCAFYMYVRNIFDGRVASIATALVLLAPVYYHGYWFFLLKNFLALAMLFSLLLAIRKDFLFVVILLSLAIPITHQSTTVIAGFVLFTLAGLSLLRKENWSLPLLSWAVLTTLYLVYHPTVAAKLAAPPSAVFLDWTAFIILSFPLLFLALWGLWKHWKQIRAHSDLMAYGLIVAVFPVFSLPYYERVFFFSIFFLAAVAAVAIGHHVGRTALLGLGICLLGYTAFFAIEKEPYFDRETENALASLDELHATDHLIVPNHLAPWAHGYTLATVYAPGVFKDPYGPEDWELYWSHRQPGFDRAFLDAFDQPLYIFVPDRQTEFLPEPECAELLTDALYRYTCYNQSNGAPDAAVSQ